MPRFAANLTMLFTEHSVLARPARAARAGFEGVEVLFPYEHSPAEWQAALGGLPVALINTPPGDWGAGSRGFAAVPGAVAAFRDSFLQGADVAARLGAARLHVMAGVAHGPEAEQTYAENLAWAVAQAPGQALCVEPLNPADMPGYFLNDYDQAARIVEDLGLPQLGLQFDLWHAARLHGDASAVWARHAPRISHVQIAGFPARNEPGGGGFDLIAFCAALDAGYDGWVAAEYRPRTETEGGLDWLAALKAPGALIGA